MVVIIIVNVDVRIIIAATQFREFRLEDRDLVSPSLEEVLCFAEIFVEFLTHELAVCDARAQLALCALCDARGL